MKYYYWIIIYGNKYLVLVIVRENTININVNYKLFYIASKLLTICRNSCPFWCGQGRIYVAFLRKKQIVVYLRRCAWLWLIVQSFTRYAITYISGDNHHEIKIHTQSLIVADLRTVSESLKDRYITRYFWRLYRC